MDRGYTLDRLEFNDDFIFHDHISPKSLVQMHSFIDHRNRLLAHDKESPFFQLISQNRLINRFQQPWPELGMDPISGVYNLSGDLVFSHLSLYSRKAFLSSRLGILA